VFGWSNIPPYRGNVQEEARGFFVWHWKLYSRGGEGICDVRYFDMNQDGAVLERWSLFGFEQPGDMPDNLARTQHKQLLSAYGRVCAAMRKGGDTKPNVQVDARCAVKGEWKQVESRKRNVCAPKGMAKPKPKPGSRPGGAK
jgi:hypothetical protein